MMTVMATTAAASLLLPGGPSGGLLARGTRSDEPVCSRPRSIVVMKRLRILGAGVNTASSGPEYKTVTQRKPSEGADKTTRLERRTG